MTLRSFPYVLLILAFSPTAIAQQVPLDLIDKVIISLFRDHNTKFLCLTENSSLPAIKGVVEKRLQAMPGGSGQSQDAIAKAVYTEFPCPFSPYREELRPASASDIAGVWLFPESSQKLRFGPGSPNRTATHLPPIRCEGVAYYPDGDARTVPILGNIPCAFQSSKDMDVSRKNPRVASWSVSSDGRLIINRTDVPGHVEEWDAFVVTKPFEVQRYLFESGEIIQYLRREKGNEFNAATTFRHLKRLP